MPFGAFKLNGLGKFQVSAAAQVIRTKKGIVPTGNTQIDTAQSKFGGSAALFDGTGDWLTVWPSNTDFQFSTGSDFTIELFVRMNSNNNTRIFWTLFDGTTARAVLYTSSTQLSLYAPALGGVSLGDFPSTATWYHLAVSRSGSTTKVFYNGTETYSTTTSWNATADRLVFGTDNQSTGANPYDGWMDEIRVSKTARYTASFTPTTSAFVNDDNTLFLCHCNGTDASTFFDDDNGVRAQIGVTAVGNAQLDTAQSQFGGSSLLLDGTGDYLDLYPGSSLQPGTGDFTWEAWVRLPNNTSDYCLMGNNGTNGDWEIRRFSDGTLRLARNDTAWDATSSVLSIANTWTHLAVSRSGTSLKMFSNGVQVYTGTNSTNYVLTGQGRIGFSDTAALNGHIDEIRISNSARYTAAFTPSTTPFVNDANTLLLLHCDGTDAGTVVLDDNGSRTRRSIIANGNAQLDTAQSKFGNTSALFDGTGDYLLTTLTLNTTFTFECWIRLANVTGEKYVFRIHNSSDTFQYVCGVENNYMYIYAGGITTGGTLVTNTWYHLAFVRNSSDSISLWLNGTNVASRTVTTDLTDAKVYLGGFTNNLGVNGHLDEIRISNTARYTANFTAPTAPFQNDADTLLLIHCDGTDAATFFVDDNGKTPT